MNINHLLKEIKKNNLSVNTDLVKRAYEFASNAHKEQKREGGEKYINHPLNVALTIIQMKLDTPSIAAALLHDVVEDTNITLKEIKTEFGNEIASLVYGVSKLGKIEYKGIERHVENLRKMFLSMTKDIRVIMIKLADRLHNMKTINALSRRKQKRIALETLEIYAPIAHRLGIGRLKGELEDLSFPYVYPQQYKWLRSKIEDRYHERELYLKKIQPIVKRKLKQAKIDYIDIHSRAKRYYSLYKKLEQYNMDFSKIYDLMASRIIVPTIEDCYLVLGLIHKNWKPLPGQIKDYIAVPKANDYKSIHTTVFCIDGKITEFQIRTPEIHWEAEYGIAAHWTKSRIKAKIHYYGLKKTHLEWIKELENWQKDVSKPKEFLDSLKIDFFKYRIFALTPKGDVVNLPEGATPVDFAYQIHTELGHRCGGAKVDEKIIPLNYALSNGQIVEIIAKKEAKPSQDWLKFVKTNYAKSKIRAWFKEKQEKPKEKSTRFDSAKQALFNLARRIPISPKTNLGREIIVQHLPKKVLKSPIKIKNEENILIKLAKCCNPIPGESILGYITTLKAITVHHHKCNNIVNKKNRERIIPVSWKNAVAPQPTIIEILARDRMDLIKDVTTILSKLRINMTNINANEPSHGIALMLITVEISNVDQLNKMEKNLREIKSVWEVKRL